MYFKPAKRRILNAVREWEPLPRRATTGIVIHDIYRPHPGRTPRTHFTLALWERQGRRSYEDNPVKFQELRGLRFAPAVVLLLSLVVCRDSMPDAGHSADNVQATRLRSRDRAVTPLPARLRMDRLPYAHSNCPTPPCSPISVQLSRRPTAPALTVGSPRQLAAAPITAMRSSLGSDPPITRPLSGTKTGQGFPKTLRHVLQRKMPAHR